MTNTIVGAGTVPIEVEVKVTDHGDSFNFTIIGMGDVAVREARDRVSEALRRSGVRVPKRVLVNLAPAEIRKEGSLFDLAIAIGIVAAAGKIDRKKVAKISFHGELSLTGMLRPVKGIVASLLGVLEQGVQEAVIPADNYQEASLIKELNITPLRSLPQVISYLQGETPPPLKRDPKFSSASKSILPALSLSDVRGQALAKRGFLIAAAGGHNLLMIGPPGCGKSMLAERFQLLLPPLKRRELLEVIKLHSVAGLPVSQYMEGRRPFRSPHHVISEAGLIGGGTPVRPGELSLAHNGVLFLDEFPEYRRGVLEGMRSPLESRKVQIARARGTVSFPAKFQLLAAMNPCPCGRLGLKEPKCRCSQTVIQNYLRKLSEPILDRIDLHIELDPVSIEDITRSSGLKKERKDEDLLSQVVIAQKNAYQRGGKVNALLSNGELKDTVALTKKGEELLGKVAEKGKLSARGYFRVLKVSRTIADLESSPQTNEAHIAEAVGFRGLDRLRKYCEG